MWITGDVDLPQAVIDAQREGRLGLFVDAGASYGPPSDLLGPDEPAQGGSGRGVLEGPFMSMFSPRLSKRPLGETGIEACTGLLTPHRGAHHRDPACLLIANHPGAIGTQTPGHQQTRTDYLKFAHNPAIPFTNNPAEQEIRMTKIRQKVSGTMRTEKGAENFADLRSYLQATGKHGIQALAALTQLTSRNPGPGYP